MVGLAVADVMNEGEQIMSHSSNMARHARKGADQVRSSARKMRRVAEQERDGIMHTVQKMGNEAVGALKDGYDDLRETASDYIDEGRSRFDSMERQLETRVKQRPLAAVLMAIGAGFVAGLLYSRR
jgi:ElaB/YqjD/DUF883 family membrane-anchored ribosome-binding protein